MRRRLSGLPSARSRRPCLQEVPRSDGGAAADSPAQWRAPDGQLHTGLVSAPSGATAGTTVRVWVNRVGKLADPPMRQRQVADRTELAEGLTAALFAVGLGAIGRQARRRLDRRQMAG